MGTPQKVMRGDLEKLACELDNMIVVADDANAARLSRALNRALDAIEQAINAVGGEG
jgi:hypothetical protein